jgi:hypothetical protein
LRKAAPETAGLSPFQETIMGVDLIQNGDGSASLRNESDGLDIMRLGGAKSVSTAAPSWRGTKIARIGVTGGVDTGGGLASFVNPEPVAIIVTGAFLDVTTASTAACAASLGTTTTSATTSSNNLIDTASVATIGLLDAVTDKGTNGKSRQKLAAGGWVTLSTASGASAGLQATLYLRYIVA